VVGDFDGDGKTDLAVANDRPAVAVLFGYGDGTFKAAVYSDLEGAIFKLAVGDFNGDGKTDLAAASLGAWVLLGNGDGSFRTAVKYVTDGTSRSIVVGDFNADGEPDLALWNENGTLSVLLNTCVTIGPGIGIVRSNNTATVSWPFPSTGFVLESATSPSPANWQPAVEVPMTNNGLLSVTVPLNQVRRYFRLRKS
jgi:hypothetical protein